MPDGERVTTGSEPRTYDLRLCSKCDEAVERNFRERWECPVHGDGITIRFMKAQVVESGHDEQTEARLQHEDGCLFLRSHPSEGDEAALCDCGAVQRGYEAWLEGQEWQLDPRTVAAVVAFVEGIQGNARLTPELVAYAIRREFEERFKPSAPGGEDGH